MAPWDKSGVMLSTILFLAVLLHCCISVAASPISEDRKLHIVYLGEIPSHVGGGFYAAAAKYHHDILESSLGSHEAAKKHLEYSYGKSFNGFAAWLSPSEVQHISKMHGVLSVFENRQKIIATTRSWDFMGFPQTVDRNLSYERDVIIGVLDTGIWPESESFNDEGLGPIPSKWRGNCQTTYDFKACNKKVIGATFYGVGNRIYPSTEFLSPRDSNGHGSHTASTAAGNVVKKASLLGVAEGNARGGVPSARIAVYKVCLNNGSCDDAAILAGFDDAIYDGVDIISVSLASDLAELDYFEDSVAIGAFHAMKRGILVSNSAGNSGPFKGSVLNYSPWSMTVAASTTDRKFITPLLLGNNMSLTGYSINAFSMEKAWYPLIYAGDAPNISAGYSSEDSRYCKGTNSLDRNKVQGKIVLCDGQVHYDAVIVAGVFGVITTSNVAANSPASFSIIPATAISSVDANKAKSYINSSSNPIASILRTVTPNSAPAPIVAAFSSRGPHPLTPGILKPDITAPGVNILAAWSKATSLSLDYNIMSGTSMSCPHVSGAAAYVKSFHPDWSPAAIKSALMTTARPLDPKLEGNEDTEFGYGAGHIDPVKAMDPGLVYDLDVDSYINFLCGQGYNATALRLLTGDFTTCPNNTTRKKERAVRELNYPSMTVVCKEKKTFSVRFPRTVTNVGPGRSMYKARISTPTGTKVTVIPEMLTFTSVKERVSYSVKVESGGLPAGTISSGSLTWNFGEYNVRSSIVVYCPSSQKD